MTVYNPPPDPFEKWQQESKEALLETVKEIQGVQQVSTVLGAEHFTLTFEGFYRGHRTVVTFQMDRDK